jgi:hypothetical protein
MIWTDDEGREYGRRDDPNFGLHDEMDEDEAWWVHLPAPKRKKGETFHFNVDEVRNYPQRMEKLELTQNVTGETRVLNVIKYPEKLDKGERVTAIDLYSLD